MKTDVSFIISIDSSFEMVNNFFEHLLQDEFALSSEIIVVLDAITNSCTIEYIKQLNKYQNINVYILDQKVGYGKANNYAVKQSQNNILYFINTDVFAEKDCFAKMLNALMDENVACVQPLLIWPQNNRIQCAGSTFGPFYKKHLFAGRPLNSIDLSNYPQERPALTSALYAMRKSDFYQYGMFDEFYYNKLESFELSLKLSLNGKRCLCIHDAIAYHSQGTGRNQYYFDFYQQEAYFWVKMGKQFIPDIQEHYKRQISKDMLKNTYYVISICQIRTVKQCLEDLGISFFDIYEINGISPNQINLYELLPYSLHQLDMPLLFFVENIMDLGKNKHWFETRNCNSSDLVIDTYGNLLPVMLI